MSYCRFNEGSDIYCYESVGGFHAVHVAGSRNHSDQPLPEYPTGWHTQGEDGIKAFMDYDLLLEGWRLKAERRPIGLPHDGESFQEADAAACLARLEMLREVGYEVPQYAIDALREEAEEQS